MPLSVHISYHYHDDVIKWKHFPRYWSFVRGIHRSPELWCFLWSHLNKRLSKQRWGWWFETPSRHFIYDVILMTHSTSFSDTTHCREHLHWNENVVILTKFSSLAALEVVILTTFSAASDENFIKMKTFPFQCIPDYFCTTYMAFLDKYGSQYQIISAAVLFTVEPLYNTIVFHQNTHKRHPIARP